MQPTAAGRRSAAVKLRSSSLPAGIIWLNDGLLVTAMFVLCPTESLFLMTKWRKGRVEFTINADTVKDLGEIKLSEALFQQ